MKSMRPPSAAIFFMTYFHRTRGGPWPPRPPLDPLLVITTVTLMCSHTWHEWTANQSPERSRVQNTWTRWKHDVLLTNRRIHVPCDSARFGTNVLRESIVVNGNHMELCQYFSVFQKTRYLIHLITCHKHVFTKSAKNRNLLRHIIHNFDSFFHPFKSNQ